VDTDDWRSQILAQGMEALHQSVSGLAQG